MYFISEDGEYRVEITEIVRATIVAHIRKANRFETGGIMVGAYSGDQRTAIVSEITGPTKDSKSGHTWFNRGVKGLKELLVRHWEIKQYYLGEWHFHPRASPAPSHQDRKQMKAIATSNQYHCPEPIMLIIGGSWESYRIAIFVLTAAGKFYALKEENI
jgi:integrative and conjugative element protein (TIGR02256 family)